MITCGAWAGKRYAVLGLARSGAATVAALVASGASVVAWDSDEARRASFPSPLRGASGRSGSQPDLDRAGRDQPDAGGERSETGEGQCGERGASDCPSPDLAFGSATLSPDGRGSLEIADLATLDLSQFDALVLSPGVALNTHPLAAAARAAGTPIIGDIELFAQARSQLPPHKVVGITGTNGKSTTTALVTHILKTAGVPALMGGNIGLPILAQEPLPEGGVYVLELSSYQIDLTQTLDCDVAVLLNITPDHLDRYDGSLETYAASKQRLFEMQSKQNVAIISGDEPTTRAVARAVDDLRRPFVILCPRLARRRDEADYPALIGPHNVQNRETARLACECLWDEQADRLLLTDEQIDEALRTFVGLPHRMERIATLGGVTWYDDSKATNPESTAPALAAFPRVHWILGGRAKGDDLDACLPHLDHVVAAYTIGEAGPAFANILFDKVQMVEHSVTLDVAVKSAAERAKRGEVVLLSPAAASFDQFRDYEHRGQVFRQLVEALA